VHSSAYGSTCALLQNRSMTALMLLYLSSGDISGFRLRLDQVVGLADDVAFEASDDAAFAVSFGGAPVGLGDCGLVDSHADDDGSVGGWVTCPRLVDQLI